MTLVFIAHLLVRDDFMLSKSSLSALKAVDNDGGDIENNTNDCDDETKWQMATIFEMARSSETESIVSVLLTLQSLFILELCVFAVDGGRKGREEEGK